MDDGAIARRAITFKQEFNLQALDSGLKDKKKVKKGQSGLGSLISNLELLRKNTLKLPIFV